jgi:hypothetical protein
LESNETVSNSIALFFTIVFNILVKRFSQFSFPTFPGRSHAYVSHEICPDNPEQNYLSTRLQPVSTKKGNEKAMKTIKSSPFYKKSSPIGWLMHLLLSSDGPVILMALALAVTLIGLSGCVPLATAAAPTQTPIAPVQPTPQAGGPVSRAPEFDVLVSKLRDAGAQVDLGEAVNQPFFSVSGHTIKVNGLNMQVFEYASPEARQAESDKIRRDGSAIGSTMVDWIDRPNFWANSRLIVLYVGKNPTLITQVSQLIGNPITQPPLSGDLVTLDKAPFALAARSALSQKLGLTEDQVSFVSAEAVQWSDSCLGLPGKNSACSTVITPGYSVIFSAGGRTYEVHTDEIGRAVRIKN